MNRLSLAAAGVAALLALSACSSSSSGGGGASSTGASNPAGGAGAPSSSASVPAATGTSDDKGGATNGEPEIKIKNFGFSGTLTVKAGAKVKVVNEDSAAHTLTDKATHKFDTGNIDGNGATGTFTAPSKPGSYPFGCTYHPQMSGTLVVTG
jgi:plastocyanin